MRTIAIGILAAAGLALSVPAFADDVSVGVGGSGVRVHEDSGVRVHEHEGYRDRAQVVVREHEHARHCRVTIVHRDGMTKKIKRCD